MSTTPLATVALVDGPDRPRDPDRPLVRSPVYLVRLLIGAALLVVATLALLVFENGLLGVRRDIATVQTRWPGWLVTSIEIALGLPILLVIVGIHVALLTHRRFRRVLMIDSAAIGAVLLGAVTSNLVLAVASSDTLTTAVETSGEQGLGNDLLASVVAVVTVASVWIGPRLRPWTILLVAAAAALSAIGAPVSIVTFPFDVGVGVVAGAIVALTLRTRDRTPSATDVARALARAGISAVRIERAAVDARGSVPWFVTTADGDELFVKTLGSDQRAADLLFRAYRTIRLRRSGDPRPSSSLRRAVEHEAFLSLAAAARHVRTPELVAVTEVGTDAMLIAFTRLTGRPLDALHPVELTDRTLAEVWRLVDEVHAAGIAHRDLRLANVLVTDDGTPWIIDFGFAELAADDTLLARDTAELLASTATVVGSRRSVAAAERIVGATRVAEAGPWIQPLALSSATRKALGSTDACAELRSEATAVAGVGDTDLQRLERVDMGTLLAWMTITLALYVLTPQLASFGGVADQLRDARLGWVLAAALSSALTYLGAGVAMVGAVPVRLPLGPVVLAQLASSFSNRITPVKVGGLATNVRFLQKQGLDLPMASSAAGLSTLAGLPVHLALMVLSSVVASRDVELPLPGPTTAAAVVGVLVLLSGGTILLPAGRRLLTRYLRPAVRAGIDSVAAIARSPTKLLALLAGATLVTLGYVAAMSASLAAFGADVAVATTAAVYLGGAAVAAAAPTPGGIGATEAALVAGFTAVGVDQATAFAAVLMFRLVTFWIPILPGWLSLIHLQRTARL